MISQKRPVHVFGYGRVSTDKQAISIEVQTELVAAEFKKLVMLGTIPKNAVFKWMVDEAVSASEAFFSRPCGNVIGVQYQAGDMILVSHFDRICRSTMDFCVLLETLQRECVLLSIMDLRIDTSTNSGAMTGKIIASVKEFERQEISRRTREAQHYRRENAIPFTSTAWVGYKMVVDKQTAKRKFVPCAETRRIALWIADQKDNHGASYRSLKKNMRALGFRHLNGRYTGKPFGYEWIVEAYKAAKADFPCCSMKDYDPNKAIRMPAFAHELPSKEIPMFPASVPIDALVIEAD